MYSTQSGTSCSGAYELRQFGIALNCRDVGQQQNGVLKVELLQMLHSEEAVEGRIVTRNAVKQALRCCQEGAEAAFLQKGAQPALSAILKALE